MTDGPAFPDARALLDKHGLRAKKHFGQNFLIADRVFRAIVDAAVAADDDWIVEIGAGLGTLTARLCERAHEGKIIALERDPSPLHRRAGQRRLSIQKWLGPALTKNVNSRNYESV